MATLATNWRLTIDEHKTLSFRNGGIRQGNERFNLDGTQIRMIVLLVSNIVLSAERVFFYINNVAYKCGYSLSLTIFYSFK